MKHALVFLATSLLILGVEPKAFINGTGLGWRAMTEKDFTNVNCKEDTWSWGKDGLIKCTGNPVGVIRTKKMVTNLELVVQWRHLKHAGNSGVFLWATPASIKNLEAGKGRLPAGIEVQVLDLGYETNWEKGRGKPSDWFTSHGDGATWLYSTGAGDEGSDGAPSVTPCVCHCLEGIEGTDKVARVRALKDWVLRTGGFLCVGGGFLSTGASFPLSSSFSFCVVIALELELESRSGFSLTVSRLPRKRARI